MSGYNLITASSYTYCYILLYEHMYLLQVTNLLKELEFIFIPFVNPDGYEVSVNVNTTFCMLVILVVCLLYKDSSASDM